MTTRQFVELFTRWFWIIVAFGAVAGGAALLVALRTPPTYQASSTLLITQGNSPPGTSYDNLVANEQVATTYAAWLTRRPVLQGAIDKLNLKDSPDNLAQEVTVQPVRGTQLLTVSVADGNPRRAAAIANALPQVFVSQFHQVQAQRYTASQDELLKNIAATQVQIADIQRRLDAARAATPADPEQLSLQTLLTQQQSAYADLLRSYDTLELATTGTQDNVIVIEQASVPVQPVQPNIPRDTLLGTVVGVLLAGALAFVIETFVNSSDAIRTPEDAQQLGKSTLGVVRRWQGQTAATKIISPVLATAAQPRSPPAEAYRILRTNLQVAMVDRGVKSLLVTSPGLGEGKSTTAANLAVVLAQAGHAVVLVDADLRRPSQHHLFGLYNKHGLSDVLQNRSALDRVVQATRVERLRVITSGPIPLAPVEVLASASMKRLAEELSRQAEVIIFDGPPVLTVADSVVLANHVDGVILVVEAGRTSLTAARRVFDSFRTIDEKLLGIVINKASTHPVTSGMPSLYEALPPVD